MVSIFSCFVWLVFTEKQMKLISCSNCSQLFDLEVFNPQLTRTICQESNAFNIVSYNRVCKNCTETVKIIQGSERPYKCSVCDKSFTLLSILNLHQKIHTEENPYKCSVCSNDFPTSSSMKRHERTHTGEKRDKCLTNQWGESKQAHAQPWRMPSWHDSSECLWWPLSSSWGSKASLGKQNVWLSKICQTMTIGHRKWLKGHRPLIGWGLSLCGHTEQPECVLKRIMTETSPMRKRTPASR